MNMFYLLRGTDPPNDPEGNTEEQEKKPFNYLMKERHIFRIEVAAKPNDFSRTRTEPNHQLPISYLFQDRG